MINPIVSVVQFDSGGKENRDFSKSQTFFCLLYRPFFRRNYLDFQ